MSAEATPSDDHVFCSEHGCVPLAEHTQGCKVQLRAERDRLLAIVRGLLRDDPVDWGEDRTSRVRCRHCRAEYLNRTYARPFVHEPTCPYRLGVEATEERR